ncbi:Serine/threonine-protein phosphatase [Entamoeba marina]
MLCNGIDNHVNIPFQNGLIDLLTLHHMFMNGKRINDSSLMDLFVQSKQIFSKELNLVQVSNSASIFGDYHGRYFDFISQRDITASSYPNNSLIFLGDYVDRGTMSCELFITLLCMKVNSPDKVIVLRGNHESRAVTKKYGFLNECKTKYSKEIYDEFCNVFDTLPLCAIVKQPFGSFFLCHGGISPSLLVVDDVNSIDRFQEPPSDGMFCDLLWADPVNDTTFEHYPFVKHEWRVIEYLPNTRGKSYFFGYHAMKTFLEINNLTALIRAHQCFKEGIHKHNFCNPNIILPLAFTLFGAADYEDNNIAGSLVITNDSIVVKTYESSELFKQYLPIYVDFIIYCFPFAVDKLANSISHVESQVYINQ